MVADRPWLQYDELLSPAAVSNHLGPKAISAKALRDIGWCTVEISGGGRSGQAD
jgi:hypothetical protein